MVKAKKKDCERITEILSLAFESNSSVNYIVKQDDRRMERIRRLMRYSIKVCSANGKVVLSDDGNAAALVMLKKKGFSVRALLLDLQLIFGVTGLCSLRKILKRESLISAQHPSGTFYYLWFVGVHPAHMGHGIGSKLLKELIADAVALSMPMCLETSTVKNLPWYAKFGFQVFTEIDIGYRLFFLKRVLHQEKPIV